MTKTLKPTPEQLKERQEYYEIGLREGRASWFAFMKKTDGVKAVILIDALIGFLDERYELRKDDY